MRLSITSDTESTGLYCSNIFLNQICSSYYRICIKSNTLPIPFCAYLQCTKHTFVFVVLYFQRELTKSLIDFVIPGFGYQLVHLSEHLNIDLNITTPLEHLRFFQIYTSVAATIIFRHWSSANSIPRNFTAMFLAELNLH